MTERQAILSGLALTVFRLNGQFLDVAEGLARPAGLTAAHWQVLGAVLREPLPVAGIARAMGITRQAVQRIADILAENGMVEYLPNPAHRRAKLVAPTEKGLEAVERIGPAHAAFADRLCEALGDDRAAEVHRMLGELSETLESLASETDKRLSTPSEQAICQVLTKLSTASKRILECLDFLCKACPSFGVGKAVSGGPRGPPKDSVAGLAPAPGHLRQATAVARATDRA